MLKSFVHQRPAKIFDPKNAEHRELFHKFLLTSSWIHCPYQWIITDDSADVVHYISKKITSYYLSQEFSKPVVKRQRKPKSNTRVLQLNSTKKSAKNG
jgi:hypothetical protein